MPLAVSQVAPSVHPLESRGAAASAGPPPQRARRVAVDSPAWLELVRANHDSLPFHQPAWSRTLAEAYGLRSFLLAVTEANAIRVGLPVIESVDPLRGRRWIGLPFTDAVWPLCDGAAPSTEQLRCFDDERRAAGVRSLEIRSSVAGVSAIEMDAGVIHELELGPDPDAVFGSFRSPTKRNVRKAERTGVVIEWSRDERDLVDVFYGLHLQTRRRQGVPIQPKRFFRALWRNMLAPGHGFVLVARLQGRAVAAAVFLTGARTIVYKFGASDPAFLNARPNNLLFWEAIRWGCENGYARFNFGRSDRENEGLRTFKSGWGAEERALVYSLLTDDAAHAPSRYPSRPGRVGRRVIGALPLVVCRTLGEALYRYAA
jgi:CelD/BcsL family acetyltransferase involved in cellulose biosynthesis